MVLNEEETLTTDGQVKDLVSYASTTMPTVRTPKEAPTREVETVPQEVIEANICADMGCQKKNPQPHRH